MEARVRQLEPECVLPVDPCPDCLRRFPIAQVLEVLQHRHQSEAPGSETGLAALRVKSREVLVAVECGELVSQLGHYRSVGEGKGRDTGRLDGHLVNPQRLEAHGGHSTKEGTAYLPPNHTALQFADSI